MKTDEKYFNCQDVCKDIMPVGFYFLQRVVTIKIKNKLMKPSKELHTIRARGFLYKEISLIFSDAY